MKNLLLFLSVTLFFITGLNAQSTANSISTTTASTISSVATGNWSSPSTWSTGIVPTLTDDVIITSGNTVTIDAAANNAKTLTVIGSLIYNASTASVLTVNGSVTVASGANFTSPSSGTIVTHLLNIGGSTAAGVGGDLVVNGLFNMNVFSTAGVVVNFYGSTSNVVSGTGTTINFYSIVVNKGTSNITILEVTSMITCADATSSAGLRLSVIMGTFKLSSASVLKPFNGSVQPTTAGNSRLWLNNAGAIIQSVGAGTVAGSTGTLTFGGMLQIDAGTLSHGNGASSINVFGNYTIGGANATLNVYGSFTSGGATTGTITAGNINIYGQLGPNYAPTTYFSQSGLFQFGGSVLNFTGGTLTIVDPTLAVTSGLNYAPYSIYIIGGTNNFTGSTIRFGNGTSDLPGGNGFTIAPGNAPLGNLIINNSPSSISTTRNVTLMGNVGVGGNLTINAGVANKLALSTFTLTLGGNLNNGGTITNNNVSSNGLVFNGTTKQTIANTGTFLTNIPNLTINNTSGVNPAVDIQVPLTVSSGLTLTNGQLGSSNASVLTLGNSAVSTTLLTTRSGGTLAGLPIFSLSGVTYSATYNAPTIAASITTAFELPASTGLGTFTVNNPSGVLLDKPVACTTLSLTSGVLSSSAANTVTVAGTLPTNITGGSSASYVNGPLTITIPYNATAANFKFPIGKTTYHLFEFSSITTGGSGNATLTAEAFDAGSYSGTAGTGLSTINTDKYWKLTGNLGSVSISTSNVRLTDTGLSVVNRIGQSNNPTGIFNNTGGTISGGTISSVNPIDYTAIGSGTFFKIGSATGFSAGTYAIGPQASYAGYAGTYPTLASAITAISGVPLTGNIIFELQPDYSPTVESYPLAFTPNIVCNASATITFRPAVGVNSIINFSAASTIISNTGADYIIFDGRNGGAGTNKYLQFTNTGTTTPTVVLTGDATNNQFLYSILKGSNTTTAVATSGIFALNATVAVTAGNNFLTVDHCNIDGSGYAGNCLYTYSTATDAIITNNNFYDFRNGSAVNLNSGSNNAVIDNNSFYQTGQYIGFAGTTTAIFVAGGNNVRISNNNIGGSGPVLTGIWTLSATAPAAYNFTGINATSLATTSKIYSNKIQNFDWKSTPATWTGIYATGVVNIGTDGTNSIGSNIGNDNIKVTYYTTNGNAQIYGINALSGASINVENNNIGSITTLLSGVTGVGSSITGINNSATSGIVRNNVIGSTITAKSISAANQTSTGNAQNVYGIVAGGTTNTVTGNTIANMYSDMTFASTSAGMIRGMKISSGSFYTITSNNIFSLSTPQPMSGYISGGSSYHSIVGIDINASNTQSLCNITGNTIYDLVNTSTNATVSVLGIYCQTSTSFGASFDKNFIHSFSTASNTSLQTGIHLNYGGPCTLQNNAIRLGIDKDGNSITSTAQINGIVKATSNACNIYFNTIYIGGSGVVSGTVKTYAFYMSVHATEDIRNNIFVNVRKNAAPSQLNYAISLAGTLTTGYNSDYNIYYVSNTDGKLANLSNGDQLTLRTLQTALQGSDLHSGFGDPLLAHPSNATSTLDLRPSNYSPAEGTGVLIPTITDDISSTVRALNTPTDIGAYAVNVAIPTLAQDIFSPAISYTNLGNGSSVVNRLTAKFVYITDNVNGINVVTGTKPRLYFKTTANTNTFGGNTSSDTGWKWVEAIGTTSPFSFNIDYSILNGTVVLNTVIQYFIVAQNSVSTPVVTFNPAIGAAGSNVSTISSAPTTPNSYIIVQAIPTVTNVGTGQTYTSLTGTLPGGLFAAINAGTIHDNSVINILSDITESGAVSLNSVNEEGLNAGTNTLTIQSDGSPHIISGTAVTSSAPMISITGAKRLIIDGGVGKLLTFRNTNSAPASTGPVIQYSNNSQNDTIRNCYLESNSTTSSNGVITVGSGTNIITVTKNDIHDAKGGTIGSPTIGFYSNNSSNLVTITNNNIFNQINAASYGIYLYGVANSCIVSGNSLYCESGTTAVGPYTGIFLQNSYNHLVSGNYIGGSAPLCGGAVPFTVSGAVNFTGINLSNSTGVPTTVQGNTIQNINMTSTSGPVFYGINNVSYGSVIITGNVIGSATTANSIQIAGTGTSAGINQTYNYTTVACTMDQNTIANITLTGTTTAPTFYAMKTYGCMVRKNVIYNIGTSSNIPVTIYGIYDYFNNTNPFTNEFSNNVISLNGGASTNPTIYGFYESGSNGTYGFYYNSINLYGNAAGSASTYSFYRGAASTYIVNNNILVNSRIGGTGLNYAIYSVPTTLFTSNKNDLFVSGTTLGHWGAAGTTYDNSNLGAWKAASGQDANSISADPVFTAATNLLPLSGSPVIGTGTPIVSIITDITGVIRNIMTPTLGAYEFVILIKSLNLTSVMLEGLYNGLGTMRQAKDGTGPHWPVGVADHIIVELHDASNYASIVYTFNDVPLSVTGVATMTVPLGYNGSYFITIKHRNSLETTTASAVSFAGSIINQSFGNPGLVYGSNLGLSGDNFYLIYGGDVNQDGAVDSGDYSPVVNDNASYASGYLSTDVNGDGSIDSGDYTIIVNNNSSYIGTAHP